MIQYKEFEIPIYKGNLIVCAHDNDWMEMNDKWDVDFFHKSHWGSTSEISVDEIHTILLSFNFGNKEYPITHGIVAHECYHAAEYKFEWCHADKMEGVDEHYSYFIEWVADRAYEFFKEFNLFKKIK